MPVEGVSAIEILQKPLNVNVISLQMELIFAKNILRISAKYEDSSSEKSKPSLPPRPTAAAVKVSAESEAWAAGLRGGDEENGSSDPLVFGKPRPQRKRSERSEAYFGWKDLDDFEYSTRFWIPMFGFIPEQERTHWLSFMAISYHANTSQASAQTYAVSATEKALLRRGLLPLIELRRSTTLQTSSRRCELEGFDTEQKELMLKWQRMGFQEEPFAPVMFWPQVESWQAGLRGGEEVNDALVFSNPSYKKPSKAPRSPSTGPPPAPAGGAAAGAAPRPPKPQDTPPKRAMAPKSPQILERLGCGGNVGDTWKYLEHL